MSNEPEYVDYMILIPGNNFSQKFMLCWSETLLWLVSEGYLFRYQFYYSPIITDVRNSLLGSFPKFEDFKKSGLPFSEKLKCKRVIFIDNDIYWKKEDFKKLLHTDKDALSGIYLLTDRKKVSVFNNNEFLYSKELENKDKVFKIDGCGFGFLSVSFDVIEKIKYPWFDVKLNLESPGKLQGEDVYFCKRLQEEGFEMYADQSIRLGHIKQTVLYPQKDETESIDD